MVGYLVAKTIIIKTTLLELLTQPVLTVQMIAITNNDISTIGGECVGWNYQKKM
ncbi:hypothetical protein YDYSY3_59900 [Paenibacillus chitinolyticus]|nr:hypothetical protein YDYSY3_59900 [Paenibacillus chitinolyticus]